MQAMKAEKINVDRVSLARLMVDMKEGRIRVPRFQRGFVWERGRIQELLDSIYKEYPIGTIFLWEAPPEYNHLLLRTVDYLQQPPIASDKSYSVILDGQQRLTSLYVVVHGLVIGEQDYRKVVVDLSPRDPVRVFQYREPDNRRWVSVQDLVGNSFEVYNNLPSDERRGRFVRCSELLRNYPFSLVTVQDMDIEEAIEIFERINRLGKRLTRYDLITAGVLDADFDLRERTRQDIVKPLSERGFGKVEETSIPQALALNLEGRTETATQIALSQKKDEVKQVWQFTVQCFLLAADYVRHNLGVARLDFLPYDAVLPMLAYYFYYAHAKAVESKHRAQLDRWFWRIAFAERYSGASQTRMTEDAAWIRDLINKGAEYTRPVTTSVNSLIESFMTSTTSAVRNGVLCLLNLQVPLHFRNATRIDLSEDHFSRLNVAERHHIFPVGFLKKRGYKTSDVHRIPNFCFIPAELNKWIGDRPPSQYMQEILNECGEAQFQKVMQSHLIPVDDSSGIWVDNYERFLRQRAELLLAEILRRCGISDRIAEEYRNPLVDAIETGLRDKIHAILRDRYGLGYWDEHVDKGIARKVDERIEDHIRKTAGATKRQFDEPCRRLEFCDIRDYVSIITQNWSEFSPVFPSKPELERNLGDFNDFRNAVKHNRSIDATQEYRARAALIWLSRVLDLDLSQYDVVS